MKMAPGKADWPARAGRRNLLVRDLESIEETIVIPTQVPHSDDSGTL
jgi:hypothetical protein